MVIATCQFHNLLTPVTIILLSVKRNKMLNIKTKFDTFQILGEEEISKRTNTRSWEGSDHAKILTKPPYPLVKFMLFISIHKIERYWKYGREILGQKTETMQLFIAHSMPAEELISTDQSLQINVLYSFRFLSTFLM